MIHSVEERQWKELTGGIDFSRPASTSLSQVIGDEYGAGTSSDAACSRFPKREGKSLFYRDLKEANCKADPSENATPSSYDSTKAEHCKIGSIGKRMQCYETTERPTNSTISELVARRCRRDETLTETMMESREEVAASLAALANFPHEVSRTHQTCRA